MFLMSRNYTLYAMLPRDEDRPAALVMPGSGVYHLEHAPTWMPNVATYLTRIDPRNIPERDFEVTTEAVDEPAPGPIMPYPTREGVDMAPHDRHLRGRSSMRSEQRRVGQRGFRPCDSRWWQNHVQNKHITS